MEKYHSFVAAKKAIASPVGFDVPRESLNPNLFDWQKHVVQWALKQGKSALFQDCGLGKSLQSLEWCRQVGLHTGGRVLILTPLAVAHQFVSEGLKFEIPVQYARSQSEVSSNIVVTNYEMLSKFNASQFSGIYLDESDILANYTGKVKQAICDTFRRTPYKLCGSATPSPNDLLELGNHSDFLDIMESSDMIVRWFTNDTMRAGGYKLKAHASADFWRWVSSWAVCISKPSDIGYNDEGYILPPLKIHNHTVGVDYSATWEETGELIRGGNLSATEMHREMRLTANARAIRTQELVNEYPNEPWLIWCNTDYEALELRALLPDAVEVKGGDKPSVKEARLKGFGTGEIKQLLTKPRIAGFGLNYQNCNRMAFVGLSYSFKMLYQAIRRSYRFGQQREVHAHIVSAETEGSILQAIERKQAMHREMQRCMNIAMGEVGLSSQKSRGYDDYSPTVSMTIPNWLTSKTA